MKNSINSFEQLRESFGLESITEPKRTKDKKKLSKQQAKFLGKCKVCDKQFTYIAGTNTLACTNPKCKGIEVKRKDGTTVHIPTTRVLDERGIEIAKSLFE